MRYYVHIQLTGGFVTDEEGEIEAKFTKGLLDIDALVTLLKRCDKPVISVYKRRLIE